MPKDIIRLVIVEDDPFSRNWMALLAARDWRTHVVGEADAPLNILPFLTAKASRVDLILMDTDIPGDEDWLPHILGAVQGMKHPPAILCTGIRPNPHVLSRLQHPAFTGYILKDEISYSLAWAVDLALEGKWVITDSIRSMAFTLGIPLPEPCVIIDGRKTLQEHLTPHQAEVARLAFLFSMERRELADELGVVEDWSYGLVSQIYAQLGVKEMLQDEEMLEANFGEHALLMAHIQKLKSESKPSQKARALETLAFHLITMPEIIEVN
jgi:DNA-binding NarL/FixJ family response regulator